MRGNIIDCPICRSKDIIYSRHTGEYICKACGYIILDKERRYYKPYKKEPSKDDVEIKSKKKIVKQYRNYRENLLEEVKDYIEKYGEALSLPSVDIRVAKILLHRVINKGRWNRKYLALALLYVSNRYNSFDKRSIKEFILLDPEFNTKKFRRVIKNVLKLANVTLKYRLDEREIFSLFYGEFGYDDGVDYLMEKLINEIKRHGVIRRKSPKTVYTTVAYIAYRLLKRNNGKENITLRRVSEIVDVSEVPIRNAVKEVLRELTIEIYI